jgi:HK97 family phage prohead protease
MTFDGYAAVFDVPSNRMSFPQVRAGVPFREIIRPGAFSKTLAEKANVTLRYQHNMFALPLASTRAGTMEIAEDAHGLRVRATLPDNEWGRPVRDAIARGDIAGMSYRFKSVRQEWATEADGSHIRNLVAIALDKEVSVTEFPAFPDTIATVRALAEDADVDPEALIGALQSLKPDARLAPEQRAALLTVINKHSDAPVIDASEAQKMAQMRERLARLAG